MAGTDAADHHDIDNPAQHCNSVGAGAADRDCGLATDSAAAVAHLYDVIELIDGNVKYQQEALRGQPSGSWALISDDQRVNGVKNSELRVNLDGLTMLVTGPLTFYLSDCRRIVAPQRTAGMCDELAACYEKQYAAIRSSI